MNTAVNKPGVLLRARPAAMGVCASTPEAPVTLSSLHEPTTHTALFFPDAAFPCRAYARGGQCHRKNCSYAHGPTSLSRMLGVLGQAKHTIEVCVFTITCNEIADALEAAAKRGVMVSAPHDPHDPSATIASTHSHPYPRPWSRDARPCSHCERTIWQHAKGETLTAL